MTDSKTRIITFSFIAASGMLFYVFYVTDMIGFLFASIAMVLLGIITTIAVQTIALYRQDKILDLAALQACGMTIVTCSECGKSNVLEDQYCIYCQAKLDEVTEQTKAKEL